MNIVITGASRGLGKAVAEAFLENGEPHRLLLSARAEDSLKAAAADLSARYPAAMIDFHPADIGSRDGVRGLADWILSKKVPVDVLVNNAGKFNPGNLRNEPEGSLEEMMQTNLYSAYHLTRALLPDMMRACSGHVFNMCSTASLESYNEGGAYSISKFALAGFTQNLRDELKNYKIKVTGIYPGAVFTDSWSGSGVSPDRIMEPGDIATMIVAASRLSPQACVEDIVLRPQLGDL